MKAKLNDKYIFIYDDKNNQIQYFEHFVSKDYFNKVIPISTENKEGEKFVKDNDTKILDMDFYWFGRKTKYKPMFVKADKSFCYIILIK